MKKTIGWLLALPAAIAGWLYVGLATVLTPIVMLYVMRYVKYDLINILPPGRLQWFNTPDAPSALQGMDEVEVALFEAKAYSFFSHPIVQFIAGVDPTMAAWKLKTWYWLGIRNQVYGLTQALSPRVAPGQVKTLGAAVYPRNNPYTPGFQIQYAQVGWVIFWELAWVWSWQWTGLSTKFGEERWGWKVQTVADQGGPIVPLLQPFKLFLTK